MAIEKTYFINADTEGTYNWLEANAANYFDSFELSEDKSSVTCFIGELDAFKIAYAENSRISFTIKTELGYSITVKPAGNSSSGTFGYIRRFTKTDFGIAFALYAEPSIQSNSSKVTARDGFYITKDINGNTSFVWMSLLATGRGFGSSDSSYNAYDGIYSINIKSGTRSLALGTNKAVDFGIAPKDYTQLFHIAIDEQAVNYLPNLMGAVYSQVIGTECTLVYNNEKYLWNGYIALKE